MILSKGHAALAQYALLCELGKIAENEFERYNHYGSDLSVHPQRCPAKGIEATTGSLGHGLAFGAELAVGLRLRSERDRVVVIVGDGECQEGSIWEAAIFAAQQRLGRLLVVVDHNLIQGLGFTNRIGALEDPEGVWHSLGWDVRRVNGHDVAKLQDAAGSEPNLNGPPRVIIADTIKGKGLPEMEGQPLWHFRTLQPADVESVSSKEYFPDV